MADHRLEHLRQIFRLVIVATYLGVGGLHLAAANSFLAIMPPVVPHPRLVILFTGGCEIAGAVGLMMRRTRRLAGVMLAIYAVCVWPANIYQALWHVRAPPLPDSWWYHGPRLAFQPVLVWWALFAGEVVAWPFGQRSMSRPRPPSGPAAPR
jgi:uncharacterized membrane protein